MKTLYLDTRSGISGDMFLAALIDLGVDLQAVADELGKLPLTGYALRAERAEQSAIHGMRFCVELDRRDRKDQGFTERPRAEVASGHRHGAHPYIGIEPDGEHTHSDGTTHTHRDARHYREIREMLEGSDLAGDVKRDALAAFAEIAAAEAVVHGVTPDEVHFHEVGALDSIIDIVGGVIAAHLLGVERVISSVLQDGTGFIEVAHGTMPVPVPAVMQMRVGADIPVRQRDDVRTELITPTGMALVKTLVGEFGALPETMRIERVGYGFGTRDIGQLNALRAVLGEVGDGAADVGRPSEEVVEITANIDDQAAESLAPVLDLVLRAGACDAWFEGIHMKKDRPAVKLTVLVDPRDIDRIVELVLRHTSTAGVRYQPLKRVVMERRFSVVTTGLGDVRVKHLRYHGMEKSKPEFEDCRRLAEESGVPIQDVYRLVYRNLDA